jgi:hypothetical protein
MGGVDRRNRTSIHVFPVFVLSLIMLYGAMGFAAEVKVPAFDQWIFQTGDWAVTDEGLLHTTREGNNTNAYVALPQQGAKHIYEWTGEFAVDGERRIMNGGLHVLCSDGAAVQRQSGYMIWQDATKIDIYRVTANAARIIYSFNTGWPIDTTKLPLKHTYRFVVDGEAKKLSVYRDNVLVGEVADDVYTSGEYISVRTNRSTTLFSDIKYWAE